MSIQNGPKKFAGMLLAVAFIATACGSGSTSGEAIDYVRARNENISRERMYDSIEGAVDFATARQESGVGSDIIVRGKFSGIEKGSSFDWKITDDGDRRIELPYGDPDALINTVHLTFDVTETLAPQAGNRSTQLTVGLAVGPDLDFKAIEADYLALDDVVLFLESSAVFDYKPDIYGILEDGQMMGVVDDDNNVTFPALGDAKALLGERDSIAVDLLRRVRNG